MSTSTLPATKTVVMFSAGTMGAGAESGVKKSFFERGGRKVMKMENVAVFRSGTFRDSIGRQATYSADDMNMFVTNFNNLRSNGVFPDVPVRKGHPQFGLSSMDGLIGYVTGMRTEEREASIGKQKFTVLLADYEILDKDAQDNIDSGLWKNRSSEVGIYTDNNDVDHAPVFMGFAYVDIPAVERLNEFGKTSDASDSPFAFSYITEEVNMTASNPVVTPPAPVSAPAPAPAPQPAAPVEFSIGGAPTTDYAAVQQYISALERQVADFNAAEAQRVQAEREAFVKSLASGESPKLAATQLDATLAFAKGLSTEQFAAWKATMETVAPNPLFQQHGGQAADAGTPQAPASPADAAFETAKQIVTNMSKAGVPAEKIKAGDSYRKVIAKEPNFVLPTAATIN